MTRDLVSWKDQSWWDRALSRSHLATQAAVLLPVIAITGLSAWTLVSGPIRAMGQSPQIVFPLIVAAQDAALLDPKADTKANPTEAAMPTETAPSTVPETAAPATMPAATPPIEVAPVN